MSERRLIDMPGGQPDREGTVVDTRQARVDRLRARVQELFPGEQARELRENIERSFLVPQVGDYHNEGMFMDSHLDLIERNIEDVAAGTFPDEVPVFARDRMRRAVARDPESVRRYVYLHDISKADCLTIKFGEEGRVMTWQEWTAMLSADADGAQAIQGDEEALRRFVEKNGISGISYWQEGADGKRQHGDIGAGELRAAGLVADPVMLAAIETHEAAYQFADGKEDEEGLIRARADRYRKIFSEMSEEARDFAMLASYVDTMASLRPDGKPNLTAFRALAASREKFESLQVLEGRFQGGTGLDKQKFQRAWASLKDSHDPLSADQINAAEQRLRQEAKLASYDLEKLAAGVQSLVDSGAFTAEERDQLLEIASKDPQGIGRAFGKKMAVLKNVLSASIK